jgi:hypothetical protein
MGLFRLGRLSSDPASLRPDLLAEPTRLALAHTGLLEQVGVVEIDPSLSDTAATQHEFALQLDTLANCVVVGGKREGSERLAACVVLADSRADVNGVVKRRLDVRKASFLAMARDRHGVRRDHADRVAPGVARAHRSSRRQRRTRRHRIRRPSLETPASGEPAHPTSRHRDHRWSRRVGRNEPQPAFTALGPSQPSS